jgi:hypothetical protein
MYGDRDYQVNWLGGETVSLAIPWSGQKSFQAAGYANMSTNATYQGGFTRQFGPLSFTRVFQSGHAVPAYQPETAVQIFQRAMAGLDIPTGKVQIHGVGGEAMFSTQGPSDTFSFKNQVPPSQESFCYVLSTPFTCTPDQIQSLASGQAIVKDFVLLSGAGGQNATVSG